MAWRQLSRGRACAPLYLSVKYAPATANLHMRGQTQQTLVSERTCAAVKPVQGICERDVAASS